MSSFPSPSHREIISTTLVKYTDLTDKDLVDDPLSTEIKSCDSPTAICHVFRQHARAFGGNPMLMTCLEVIVGNLQALSLAADPQAASPPVQLVFSSINILLSMAKRDAANCDPLVDLFGYVENILKRLKIYPDLSVIPGVTQILVEIMAELVFVFATATRDVKDGPLRQYAKKLREEIDVEKILYRLDRLTPEEAQRTVTPTLEVIYHLVHNLTRVMEYEGASTEGINQALLDIQRAVIEKAGVERRKLQEELRRWLSPPDPSTNHNIAREAHHDGTATWVIEDKTFRQWKTTGGQLLGIYGNSGSGKTVLCSTIIDHARLMRETGLVAVGYFYVDFRDRQKQGTRGLLSSLLAQLCTQSEPFLDILSMLRAKHHDGVEQPSEDALAMCLREMLEYPEQAPVFIVVDALDECPDSPSPGSPPGVPTPRQSVLKIVKWLMELKLQNLHFCLTSRPEFDIQQVLDPLEPVSVRLHDKKGQIDDIAQYVKSVVFSDVKMREWPKETKKLVIDTLANKSQGMFRWASCQLEILRHCLLRDIQVTLDSFPSTLYETYERMLENIDERKRKFAHYIFQFLTVSVRPLSVQELAEVFAISSDEEPAGIPKFDWSMREPDAESAVRSVCSSLISIDDINGEQQVRFSHFTVQEFLTSDRLGDLHATYHVLPKLAHIFSAKVCLSVLLKLNSRIANHNVKEMFPLATYAAQHWVDHVKSGDASSLVQLEGGMNHLFDEKRPQFAAWIWVYDIDNPSGPHLVHYHPRKPEKSPLYYAALCGFLNIVENLAKSHPDDINSVGRDGRTPLHAASRSGNSGVALALLEKGANANARDDGGETPLQIASWRGDIEVMESLLNHGANLDAKNKDNETPLSLASSKGNLGAVRLLLDRRPDLAYQQVARQRTALHLATIHGHQPIAELLLDRGADINAEDEDCRTPLHLAADQGKDDIASLLLQRGAKVNVRDELEITPLHLASGSGQLKVAEMLLDKDVRVNMNAKDGHPDPARALVECGTDVSAKDVDGWTALHVASYNGYKDLAQILVEHGADVTAQDNTGSTPLDRASEGHHHDLAELLIRHIRLGADLAAQDKNGLTPQLAATESGPLELQLARVRLKRDADAVAQDKDGPPRSHWGEAESESGHVSLMRRTSEPGADATEHDNDRSIPLRGVSESGRYVDLAQLLVPPSASMAAQGKDRWTPPYGASERGHVDLMPFHVEDGAGTIVKDMEGPTPLNLDLVESEGGRGKPERSFDEHGADVAAQDLHGWTQLHEAAQAGDVSLARSLVEHGADTNAQDRDGVTPLHWVSQSGHVDLAQLLIEYGADVVAQDNDGSTPLHWTSESRHVEFAQLLIEHGAKVTAQDKGGSTPLHWASRTGRIDLARLLVEQGAVVTAQDKDGFTPLQLASQNGHVMLTRFLEGVVVTTQDKDGSTPLHQASQDGHLELTLVLLGEGAGADSRDENGVTPVHLASRFGHLEIVRALLTHGAYASPRDESGWTPLHFASEEGRLDIVRLLLDHGGDNVGPPVDLNVENEDQQTPLFLASRSGRPEVVQFLLERGADIERHDWLKRTPLHVVSKIGHYDATRLLLGRDANVNAKDECLWTPLHMASKSGKHLVIQLLLDRGADAGAQNDLCQTPLHMASQEGHLEVVLLLLRYTADVHTPDVDGETALHLAAYYGHLKVTELLLKHNANIHNRNKKGETPLDLASKGGHQEVAKLLAVGVWDIRDTVLAIRGLVCCGNPGRPDL